MFRLTAALIATLGLAACNGQPLDGGLGGPKMVDAIANGVPINAAPIRYFHQGVRGAENSPASLSEATFNLVCDPNFAGGGTMQQRADASAQYSEIAREKVLSWLVNPRVKGELMREVYAQSVAAQGCAPADISFQQITTDEIEVAQFVIENDLLDKIVAMGN